MAARLGETGFVKEADVVGEKVVVCVGRELHPVVLVSLSKGCPVGVVPVDGSLALVLALLGLADVVVDARVRGRLGCGADGWGPDDENMTSLGLGVLEAVLAPRRHWLIGFFN